MLIWAMLDCRYKLDHIGIDRSKKEERVLKNNPGDWMKLQLLGPLGGKSTIQNKEESSQLDWCSRRLD